MNNSGFAWLSGEPEVVARHLLGCDLERQLDSGEILSGRIVEVEAYKQTDAASHSSHGITPRTAVMFGPPGFAYVYFSYGMHHCMNIVVGPDGYGAAVLIRSLEPLKGIDQMRRLRHQTSLTNLCSGPGKLCQALAIDRQLNGHNLGYSPLLLRQNRKVPNQHISASPRIGISRAQDKPWRFYINDSPYISGPRRANR